ncbi:hypothetical protein CQ476_21 [TM7 phage DolZOral124_53_65]|nr:hypothetical protein CQ476_21 [TM7 phage DolZOral124_53_65]
MEGGITKIVEFDEKQLASMITIDKYLSIVNSNPPASFVKNHPTAKGVQYIPIDKIEWLLTRLYQKWHVEIIREGTMFNSVYVTIRLHYYNPVSEEWEQQEGVGAVGMQTAKGAKATDMTEILGDAVMKGLPAAEAYAIKDAAEKIGRLFGKDLNRKDTYGFAPAYDTAERRAQQKQEIKNSLADLSEIGAKK